MFWRLQREFLLRIKEMKRLLLGCVIAAAILTGCGQSDNDNADNTENAKNSAPTDVVNVYSARHYDSDKLMFDTFEADTGIKVRLREAKGSTLLEAMKVESSSSPADIVISADAGILYRFQSEGLLQPTTSGVLSSAIPEHFREPEGYWFGLSKRARIIVYDPERVSAEQVRSYSDLAAPEFAEDVCMRSSSNIYNLSLMADLIERLGRDEAEALATNIVENFARQPKGGDTAQIQSVAAGECAVAFTNHYYWVRLTQSGSEKDQEVASKTKLSFPEQETTGTHVNVTAAGIAANAPNKENAIKLLEWLAAPTGQAMLVAETKEFPILADVKLPDGLETLPSFKESTMPLTVFGERQSEAQQVYDRAGWN